MSLLTKINSKILQSPLVKNSAWGIISNVCQVLFVSAFFAIVARKFSPDEFGQFLISTTVYQLVAAFSSMGLGQWFIRQYAQEEDQLLLTGKFLKTQIGLGLLFYLVNIAFAYLVYSDPHIRVLCLILGTNIIFDNFIYAIRSLNIAEHRQNKTATIFAIDGFLKLIIGCLLFIYPFSSVTLACLLILVRILTLSLFIKVGSSNSISLKALWKAPISLEDLKILILKNWQFIVIGSISIIYWRIGNIIISKFLSLSNVADYEIAFRIFSIPQILPIVASATIYPQFIKYVNENDYTGLKKFYKTIATVYSLFAILSYAFIYSFSDLIITLAFGNGYPGAAQCLREMFLTFLFLPTVLLQANLIVAVGFEKLDMWCNITSLLVNVVACLIGLHYIQSLSVVNYSILFSFVVFHILQDIFLVQKKITTLTHSLLFYITLASFVLLYHFLMVRINPYLVFTSIITMVLIYSMIMVIISKRKIDSFTYFKTALSRNK